MAAQERLIIYNKALKDYKRANGWWSFLYNPFYTERGFCRYFGRKFDIREDLPELWNQHPNYDKWFELWWFNPGELEPRIKCLEKAIEECRLNIYKELEIIKV